MQVLVVQHAPDEGLGRIAHDTLDVTHDFARIDDVDGVVVLGGPMGVYETATHPRLLDEMKLIERALARDVPLLGVCLGSQLLAHVLGANVRASGRIELGFHDVTLSDAAARDPLFGSTASPVRALHWHGDVFDLPKGAVHLARSVLTEQQAFSYRTAWGLLFHLEADVAQVQAMARAFPDDVRKAGTTTEALLADAKRSDSQIDACARKAFGAWRAIVQQRAQT